jgi:carboxyl-terminal processing protease
MLKSIIRTVGLVLIAMLFVSGAYLGGWATNGYINPPPAPPSDSSTPSDWKPTFGVFWEAWNLVHQDFYKVPIDDSALVNGAVGGMVDSLGDPHTAFTEAKIAAISRTQLQGSFEGIGATVEMVEGRLTVVSPISGSPAEKAGILPGDIILEVDGTAIQGMDINQAISLIRGPKGSTVKIKVQRAKQPTFEVSLVRDTIRTTFVTSKMIEGTSIGYIRMSEFGQTAGDELRVALQTLNTQKPKALILDLRRNPGGFLTVAVDVASEFLPKDQTVIIEKDKNGKAQKLTTTGGALAQDLPMVLLVDNGSASASEILSGAMRDYKRATIIGVRTYGKGSVQNVHTLSDNSELRVTIAHFFSPLDKEIDQVGINPDIEIKISEDDIANKRDPQLDAAIDFLKKKVGTTSFIVLPQWTDLSIGM